MVNHVIIVAGGSGTRMGSDIPKQFLLIGKKPILMHTIEKFFRFDKNISCIVVLPESQIEFWKNLCKQYSFTLPHKIVSGGYTRFQSVKNGLEAIHEISGIVAVHDGVRPLISVDIISKSYSEALLKGNAIVAVKLKDSIRITMEDGNTKAIDRNKFNLIQTPQTFDLRLLKDAFLQPESNDFTDDASVIEKNGAQIHLIEGTYQNIKITTQEDLIFAEAILKSLNKN